MLNGRNFVYIIPVSKEQHDEVKGNKFKNISNVQTDGF